MANHEVEGPHVQRLLVTKGDVGTADHDRQLRAGFSYPTCETNRQRKSGSQRRQTDQTGPPIRQAFDHIVGLQRVVHQIRRVNLETGLDQDRREVTEGEVRAALLVEARISGRGVDQDHGCASAAGGRTAHALASSSSAISTCLGMPISL
jgi:hypothetical protein